MLTAGIYASGAWGVSFRKRDDVLYCWLASGECDLIRAHHEPLHLQTGDFILIRTISPFALASDPAVEPEDSETVVATTNDPVIRFDGGPGPSTVVRGGRLVFESMHQPLLMELMPTLIHISRDDSSSWRVQSLLKLVETESNQHGPGNDFIVTRLIEVILVELLRQESLRVTQERVGLLAGLGDATTARALLAMHAGVARNWTVAELARQCNVSRSTFAAHFRKLVGVGPMDYLSRWRMSLARDELIFGTKSIGEIALAIGFQSSSAFSTAFTKATGRSPRQFQRERENS